MNTPCKQDLTCSKLMLVDRHKIERLLSYALQHSGPFKQSQPPTHEACGTCATPARRPHAG